MASRAASPPSELGWKRESGASSGAILRDVASGRGLIAGQQIENSLAACDGGLLGLRRVDGLQDQGQLGVNFARCGIAMPVQ